jgi:hypothetical protein
MRVSWKLVDQQNYGIFTCIFSTFLMHAPWKLVDRQNRGFQFCTLILARFGFED